MIKLLNRKPRKRHDAPATIVTGWNTDGGFPTIRLMSKADAEMLHEQGKVQMLDMGKVLNPNATPKQPCYGPRRSWRQMLHNKWPPHHPDTLALCDKYDNANPPRKPRKDFDTWVAANNEE